MKKLIVCIILFIFINNILSEDLIDERLLSIYLDEKGNKHYECLENNKLNNKLIIDKKTYKLIFDKNTTQEEFNSLIIDDKYSPNPCETLKCDHGFCFLMVERYTDNWAYCECDKGYYGKYCQFTQGESLKYNLNSTFFIDVDKRSVTDKINDFFQYNIIPKTIGEIYEVISIAKDIVEFYTKPVQTLIHNTFGQIFSKTVKKLLNLTPLKKYEGITNFFGSLVNVIIDIFTRRLRNLEETQEELNLTIEQYAEINRYRGIKVLQEGYYTRKVDRDKLFKILYVAEVAKAENISFYDWPEKYNKKCREHSFWKGYEKYAIVITEITNTELREVFPNPCLKKIYTLDDNINVEEKCLELLKISKDSFDQQKRKCYYYPKNVINNDDENIQKIETSSKFIKKSYIIFLIFLLF